MAKVMVAIIWVMPFESSIIIPVQLLLSKRASLAHGLDNSSKMKDQQRVSG